MNMFDFGGEGILAVCLNFLLGNRAHTSALRETRQASFPLRQSSLTSGTRMHSLRRRLALEQHEALGTFDIPILIA